METRNDRSLRSGVISNGNQSQNCCKSSILSEPLSLLSNQKCYYMVIGMNIREQEARLLYSRSRSRKWYAMEPWAQGFFIGLMEKHGWEMGKKVVNPTSPPMSQPGASQYWPQPCLPLLGGRLLNLNEKKKKDIKKAGQEPECLPDFSDLCPRMFLTLLNCLASFYNLFSALIQDLALCFWRINPVEGIQRRHDAGHAHFYSHHLGAVYFPSPPPTWHLIFPSFNFVFCLTHYN